MVTEYYLTAISGRQFSVILRECKRMKNLLDSHADAAQLLMTSLWCWKGSYHISHFTFHLLLLTANCQLNSDSRLQASVF
jgi:hypothetical protein